MIFHTLIFLYLERIINGDKYSHLWNAEHIERVEVVLKESEDVVGCIKFLCLLVIQI